MATQADTPEDILPKKIEVEHTGLTIGQFERTVDACFLVEVTKYESQVDECPETQECKTESENKQVACSIQIEVINNVINGNSGTSEGESFLASPSGPTISNKGASGPEDRQVDELSPSEVEISETAEHLEKEQKFEAMEGTAREVVVEEKHQDVDQVDKNLGQNVEVILNQQDSVDQGSGSIEKERDSEKDEREISCIPEIPEVTLDHKDVQSVAETCPKEQNIDNTTTTEATILEKKNIEERSFEETKEEDKYVDLVSKGKDSEATCSSEAEGIEDEKNQITQSNAGDAAALSTIASSYEEIQKSDNGEFVKDVVEGTTVTDEPRDKIAGITEKEKHEDVPDPACSQHANESSGEEKVEAPIENEMQNKDSSVALFVEKAEEECLQEKYIPELAQVSSEIGSEHDTKESPIEVTKQTEILEETTEAKGTASGDIKNSSENFEQELEIPSKKPEEIHEKDERLDITEGAVEEKQNTEGSSLVEAEDISTVKLIQAEELTEAESTKHEDHPDDNLLPQSEPEEKKLQTHFNVDSEEITSAALGEYATTVPPIKEEGETKSLGESFKESEKKEEQIPICDIRGNDNRSEEITNLPLTHSEKKIENAEAELSNNDANNSSAMHSLVEQSEVQGEKIDEVSGPESHEKYQTSDEASEKQEKHVEAESEGYQSIEKTIVTSTEVRAPQEILFKESEKTEEPGKDSGASSKESLESQDAGESELDEIKKEAEVMDTDVQKLTSSQESEESLTMDDIPAGVNYTVRYMPEEEASKPTGEDESPKQESIGADSEKEQISENDDSFSTPEPIQEGRSKSSEDYVKEAEKLNEEESIAEITKKDDTNDLSLENIQEDATVRFKDNENEVETSKEEVLEELETVGVDESIPCEAKDIESTVEASLVKQEGQDEEYEHVDQTEASIQESKVEVAEEEASKSSGEDEIHTQESIERNVSKDQIIERGLTFSTTESVQDEITKSSRDNIKEAEITKKDSTNDLSLENIQEDATERFKDYENEAEKSKEEVLEEWETVGVDESIPCEAKDIESTVEALSVKQEGEHEEGEHVDQTEASIQESKVEVAEEEASKSSGEDEIHTQESIEGNVNKDQIIERDLTFSTTESAQDEITKSSRDSITEAENLNEEESTVEIIKEGKLDDLSTEDDQKDATKTLEGHENEAEKSKEEIVGEIETAGAGVSVPCETIKDVESFIDASSVKEEEVKDQDPDPIKASMEENKVEIAEEETLKSKHEDERHRQEAETDKEQIIEEEVTSSVAESIQVETSNIPQDNLKDAEKLNDTADCIPENNQEDEIRKLNDHENEAEKCKEEVVQESETTVPSKNISFEANENVEKFDEASSIKQEEGQEEEVKYQDPIKASTQENKVETQEDKASESKNEDENHRQESTVAGFNEGQIVGEDTFSTVEPIREETSKSSQDNIKDAEKLIEEHPAEITKESNINNLSLENFQEDAIEVLKDPENEVQKSSEEVRLHEEFVEESETTGPSENISFETNKDVEEFVEVSSIKQEEGQQDEGEYVYPTGASIEENIPEVPKEEASKSGGDNESHRYECAGADFDKEQIIGKEVAFSNPESTQEETSNSSHDNIKDVEKINEEHPTEITKGGDINDFSPENIQKDAIEASKNHEKEVEKPKEEAVEESETANSVESIPPETNKEVERFEGTASLKQEEAPQEEREYLEDNKPDIPEDEASKSRGDIESHKQESTRADFNKEQIVEREVPFLAPESVREEKSTASQDDVKNAERIVEESTTKVTKEDEIHDPSQENIEEYGIESFKDHENEADKSKEVVEELEGAGASESISSETNKEVESSVDASPRKEEEVQQEEGEYIDPNGASVEENKVEIFEEEASELKGEDEGHKQESITADFDKEIVVGEVATFSATESIEEEKSKSSPYNIKDAETTTEDPPTEITKEDTNEVLKDHESEIEKSQEEVVQEIETAGLSESIPSEINKDVEGSVDASLVKQEDSQQDGGKYLDQVQASREENKIGDRFSTEGVKNDEGNNKVKATEREIESKSEEKQQAMQKDDPAEKLEILHHVMPEETESEKSSEIARELTSVEVEGTTQDLNKISETEKGGEKSRNVDDTYDSEETPKELETAGGGESIPCKIDEDAESSVDASSVKQEESQQEEVKDIDQVEASTEENKVEETITTEVVKDEHGQKDENLLHGTPKETETETSTENDRSITSMEMEETAQNLQETTETEKTKHVDNINDSEEIPKELETATTSESSPYEKNEDVQRSVDASLIKQEEIPQEVAREDDNSKVVVPEKRIEVVSNDEEDQQRATKKDEPGEKLEDLLHATPDETETQPSSEIRREITCIEVDGTATLDKVSETEYEGGITKDTDGTNDLEKEISKELETAEAGESIPTKINSDAESSVDASSVKQEEFKYTDQVEASIKSAKFEEKSTSEAAKDDDKNKVSEVASKGEEDRQKYEPGEKLEKLLHVMPEETETETSTENVRNITSMGVDGTAQNVKETSDRENVEHIDSTNDSEKEIPQDLQTDGTSESITCETNENVERSVVTSSVKQEDQQEEDTELEQIETLKDENKVEDSFSTVVVKEYDDNKDKVTERGIEEDQQQATQKDESGEKHDDLFQVRPKETETETSSGNATDATCAESEGTIQDVEEILETENKDEKIKDTDNANDSEKEVLETTSAGQETREEVSREIDSVEEFSQKCIDTETTEETKDKIVEESSKEVEKEEEKRSDSEERSEVADLTEEIKPNKDLCTTITTEAPEEETEEKEPAVHDGSDSGSAGILTEETSLKESKPDDKEEIKSYEIVVEDKGLENNEVQSESVLTENLSGETGLKEGEPDKEEHLNSSDIAPEDKGATGSVTSVTTEIAREETCLEEAKPDVEEKIKSSDNALEEEDQERSVDVDVQSDFSSIRIEGEETSSKEVEPETVEHVKSSDVASEEKSLASNVIVEEQSNSVSTANVSAETIIEEAKQDTEDQGKNVDSAHEEKSLASNLDTEIVSEETSLQEAASNNEDHVQSRDFALEQEGLVSETEVEVQSASAATESEETDVKEAKRDHEEHVSSSDIAFDEKSLESSLRTEIVSEETSLKEATVDNDDHVQSHDFALEKEGLVSEAEVEVQSTHVSAEIVSEETGVKEAKDNREDQFSSSEIAFEESSLKSSLDTKIVSEETSFKEVKSEDGVQIKDSAPKKVESDSVSAGIKSEETCLKEDKPKNEEKVRSSDIAPEQENLVSEEMDLEEAESDNQEGIKNSDIAAEKTGVVSNVVSDVQQKEILESEENDVNKVPEVTGECEEKIEQERKGEAPIPGTEDTEQDTKADTPLEDSSEENLQDSSNVPSIKHEHMTAGESERSNEITSIYKIKSESVNLPFTEPTKEELSLDEEDDSKLESYDTEKKISHEEIPKQRDDELSTPPEITFEDATPKEVEEGIEKAVEDESRKELVTDKEIDLKESHPVPIVGGVSKENVSGQIVTEVVKATNSDEHVSCMNSQPEETATKENIGEVDDPRDKDDTTTVREEMTVTNLGEAQPAETDSEERNIVLQESESDILPAQKVESVVKLEERPFDLDQVDQKETERATVVEESCAVNEAEETKQAVEKLEIVESKEEIKEIYEYQGTKSMNEDEIKSGPDPDDGISKGQEHETETTGQINEEIIKGVECRDEEKVEASSATDLEREAPSDLETYEVAEERLGKEETTSQTVFHSNYETIQAESKHEVNADQDHHIGVSSEQVKEIETTKEVKKTEEEARQESLVLEKAEETIFKEENEEGITEAPLKESNSDPESNNVATADKTIEDQAVLPVTSKDELQVLPLKEEDNESTSISSATKAEEPRKIKASESDSIIDVAGLNETQAETKEGSKTVSEYDSQSFGVVTEEKKITCKTLLDNTLEVPLLEQSYVLLHKEQEDGITTTAKETEEKRTEETCSQKEVLAADKIEDITEASEAVSKENSPANEAVSREVCTEKALPVVKLITDQALKIPSYSTPVPTDETIEEEKTKEEAKLPDDKNVEDSSSVKAVEVVRLHKEGSGDDVREVLNEVPKEEGGKFKRIEPQESEGDTREVESPSECDKDVDVKEAVTEASNLNTEKREIDSDLVSEKVDSPEARTSIEEVEIIENHLKVATTELRIEEPRYESETTVQEETITEKEISNKEELSTEISQDKGGLVVKELGEIIEETNPPKEGAHATCKDQTTTEDNGKESLETRITTSDKDVTPNLSDRDEETLQRAEPKDKKAGNDVSLNREITDVEIEKEEIQGDKETGGSNTDIKPAVLSLSEILQSSEVETAQVAEHSTEQREETTTNGREAEKAKTDERDEEDDHDHEHEHEHGHEEGDHPDGAIIVQASRDIDPKVGRKKSHGIFSGVGSKVKHSISKVKKAITGKSSHSKTLPNT